MRDELFKTNMVCSFVLLLLLMAIQVLIPAPRYLLATVRQAGLTESCTHAIPVKLRSHRPRQRTFKATSSNEVYANTRKCAFWGSVFKSAVFRRSNTGFRQLLLTTVDNHLKIDHRKEMNHCGSLELYDIKSFMYFNRDVKEKA